MARVLGLHPMAKTPLGKAIILLHRQASEPFEARLVCLGCGCTDDRACAGGCSWSQPGICTKCAPRTAKLLLRSKIADDLVTTRALNFKVIGRSSFRIMSLAMLSWLRTESAARDHHDYLRDGCDLKPFTTVRIGKTCWSFQFIYAPRKGDAGITTRISWRLNKTAKR